MSRAHLEALPRWVTTGIGGSPSTALSWETEVPWLAELVSAGETVSAARTPAAWPTFLEEVARRRPAFAKVQLPGPLTCGRDLGDRARRYIEALRALQVTPLVFVDEPLLVRGGGERALLALRDCIAEAGGISGLHCCGQADWPAVLALDFDVVSLDARLSLASLLRAPEAWRRFVDSGAWLALGIIPTDGGAPYRVRALCDDARALLGSFERALLTPACGLGLFDVPRATRVVRELTEAAAYLRGAASTR